MRLVEIVVQQIIHCMTLVSWPPVEISRESSCRKRTAVTWLLWPEYTWHSD
jgi:hypothetical protein